MNILFYMVLTLEPHWVLCNKKKKRERKIGNRIQEGEKKIQNGIY